MAQEIQQWDAAHVAVDIIVALAGMKHETQHSICICMVIGIKKVHTQVTIVNSQD